MTTTVDRRLPFACLLSAALILSPALAGSAIAHEPNPQDRKVQTNAAASALNLLSAPREGRPVVSVRQMGSGSWICSPAGFGQRSRCYRG